MKAMEDAVPMWARNPKVTLGLKQVVRSTFIAALPVLSPLKYITHVVICHAYFRRKSAPKAKAKAAIYRKVSDTPSGIFFVRALGARFSVSKAKATQEFQPHHGGFA